MGSERRQFPRAVLPFPTHYRAEQGGFLEMWKTGTILDFSAGGLRFVAEDLLESGARVEFKIAFPNRKEPYMIVGCVVRDINAATDAPEYGVQFVDVDSMRQAEIDQLVAFLRKSQPNR